jgi:hypothetical protein
LSGGWEIRIADLEPAHGAVVGSLQAGVFLLSVLGLFDDPGSAAAAWYRHVLGGALDAQAAADAILFEYFEATLHGIHDRLLDACAFCRAHS